MAKRNRLAGHKHDDTEKHFERGIYQRVCTGCGKPWTPPYRASGFGRPESEREYLTAQRPSNAERAYRVPTEIPDVENDSLERIYREIPRVACRGLCYAACRAIMLSEVEYARIEALGPIPEAYTANGDPCPLLDKRSHRCTVYDVRPLICRIYATVKKLRCPHGCTPKRWLSDEEATILVARVDKLSGAKYRGLEVDVDELASLGRSGAVAALAKAATGQARKAKGR